MPVGNFPEIDLRSRVLYNPNLESVRFNMPGLIGLILQNITVMLTAFALVRERERGNIEQLVVTPITSLELIIGKLIPYLIIGFCDFLLVLAVSTYCSGCPLQATFLYCGLSALFLICALALGIFFSIVAAQPKPADGLLPSAQCSPVRFHLSPETMPQIVKDRSTDPITYFLQIL